MTINQNIRLLRQKCGLTQEQLGEKIGVSAQSISKWEQSLTSPDISLLPLLAECFGVTIDSLFLGVPARKYPGYSNERSELLANYTHSEGTDEDFRIAESAFSEVILNGKAMPQDYVSFGILHRVRAMRDINLALSYYRRAISEWNHNRDLHWMSAHQCITNLLADIGQLEEAVAEKKAWRDAEPDCAWAYVSYAYALELAGQLEEAWNQIETALRLAPEDVNVQTSAGDLCAKLRKPEEAIRHWTAAYNADPGCISCLFSKAEMFASMGENEKAIHQYEQILLWLESHGYNMELEGEHPRHRIQQLKNTHP